MKVSIHILLFWMVGAGLVILTGCNRTSSQSASIAWPTGTNATAAGFTNYSYEVINAWPHDTNAFTQGLLFWEGGLLESTGINGQSTLRKVDLETGQVLQQVAVPAQYFAEGLTVLDSKVFQLTYLDHTGFVYDLQSFQLLQKFNYRGEGWGLTTDGRWLILSDGTDQIRFLDPLTFKVERTIRVNYNNQQIKFLNELEYIKGEIFANVWGTDYVVRIDPATGRVTGMVDFTGLLEAQDRSAGADVLNGIAYDDAGDRLFVTGKRWPKLFEVRLKLE